MAPKKKTVVKLQKQEVVEEEECKIDEKPVKKRAAV